MIQQTQQQEDGLYKQENAQSKEEVKDILNYTKKGVEDAGIILDDTELDQVAGGINGIRVFVQSPGATQFVA